MKMRKSLAFVLSFVLLLGVLPIGIFTLADSYTRMEAEDQYYSGWKTEETGNAKSGKILDGGQTANQTQSFSDLKTWLHAGQMGANNKGMAYVEYVVDAPAAGEYDLKVGFLVGRSGTMNLTEAPWSTVIVNDGNLYKAVMPLDKVGGGVQEIPVTVELKKGRNVIRTTHFTTDQQAYQKNNVDSRWYWMQHDYLDIDSDLTAVSGEGTTLVLGTDSSNTTNGEYVAVNRYTLQAAQVGTAQYNHSAEYPDRIATTKLSLEKITAANIATVPYFAMRVSAPADGYYPIAVQTGVDGNRDTTMGLIVDGAISVHKFKAQSGVAYADISTYLTKGEHVIAVTVQMPATEAEAQSYTYSWQDMKNIRLGGGLAKVNFINGGDLQLSEIATLIDGYTRIQAEDSVSNIYDTVSSDAKFSGGKLREGASTSKQLQTFADLEKYLDKNLTSYIEYYVDAPADGNYKIKVGMNMGGTNPGGDTYVGVAVNGGADYKAYKANYTSANWNKVQESALTVALKKGRNVIRVTGILKGQTAHDNDTNKKWTWCQHDYLDVEKALTVAPNTYTNMKAGDQTYVAINLIKDNGDTLGNGSYGLSLTNVKGSAEIFDATNIYRVPYFAFKVNAPADGYYSLSFNNSASDTNKVASHVMIVNGKKQVVTAATDSSDKVNATCYLKAGENAIAFSYPMPIDYTTAKTYNYGSGWADFKSVDLGGGLTPVAGIKLSDIQVNDDMAGTRVEAEDDKVYKNLYGKIGTDGYPSGGETVSPSSGAVSAMTQSFEDIKNNGLNKVTSPYIQYNVIAPADGQYKVAVGMIVGAMNREYLTEDAYATVIVNNDAPVKAVFDMRDFNFTSETVITLNLKQGANAIKLVGFTTDQEGYKNEALKKWCWLNYDYLTVQDGLTIEACEITVVDAYDEDYAEWNLYSYREDVSGGTVTAKYLGNDNYYTAKRNKLSIADISAETISKFPYYAVKVKAVDDGYYDIMATLSSWYETAQNKAIGVMVDGVVYTEEFTIKSGETKIDASMFLTKGEHILVFTSILPKNAAEAENYTYNWTNHFRVELGAGLTPVKGLTLAEVEKEAEFDGTRIEAEDANLSNVYGKLEEQANASAGKVVTGASNSKMAQTYDEIAVFLDKTNTAYVQYEVTAPVDGDYRIRVGMFAGASKKELLTENMYTTVLVNDDIYKAVNEGNLSDSYGAELTVSLKKGVNVIRCIGLTRDQQAWKLDTRSAPYEDDAYKGAYCWLNQDYLDIDSRLTQVKKADPYVLKANDTGKLFANLFTPNDTGLGKDTNQYIMENKLSLEDINATTLRHIPHIQFTIDVPANGYYDITVNSQADDLTNVDNVGKGGILSQAIIVDGQQDTLYFRSLGKEKVNASRYLTAGKHTVIITVPLPETKQQAETYGYSYLDFFSVSMSGGITVTSDWSTKYELEDYALANLARPVELKGYSGTGYAGGAQVRNAQKVDDILKNGIDFTKTPFVSFVIEASEKGEYEALIGFKHQKSGSADGDKNIQNAYVVVEVGNTRMVFNQSVFHIRQLEARLPVILPLAKGRNEVRITFFTGDSVKPDGDVWMDFDYIQIEKQGADKLSFKKVFGKPMEAENAEYDYYSRAANSTSSGGAHIGSAAYGDIADNNITFERINMDSLDNVAHVTYTFNAEKAGTYPVTVQFRGGALGFTLDELKKAGPITMAYRTNSGKAQKLDFYPSSLGNAIINRVIYIDVVEGENTLTVTTTLAGAAIVDFATETEKLYYIDHDCIRLSAGLFAAETEGITSVADTGADDALIKVKNPSAGNTQQPDKDTDADADAGSFGGWLWIIIGGVAVLAAAAVVFIILFAKKKKKNN